VSAVLPFRLKAAGQSQVAAWYAREVSYRIHGVARIEERRLVLQWSGAAEISEVKGTAARVREEALPVRTVALPVTRVAGLRLRGWWRLRIELHAADLELLAGMPGAERGMLTLWIARRDRAAAIELITDLEIQQADAALAGAEAPPALPEGLAEGPPAP
jgi:hypothetical protein